MFTNLSNRCGQILKALIIIFDDMQLRTNIIYTKTGKPILLVQNKTGLKLKLEE